MCVGSQVARDTGNSGGGVRKLTYSGIGEMEAVRRLGCLCAHTGKAQEDIEEETATYKSADKMAGKVCRWFPRSSTQCLGDSQELWLNTNIEVEDPEDGENYPAGHLSLGEIRPD